MFLLSRTFRNLAVKRCRSLIFLGKAQTADWPKGVPRGILKERTGRGNRPPGRKVSIRLQVMPSGLHAHRAQQPGGALLEESKMYTAKQMIVMRRDLHMRKGKIAAQAGHACVTAVLMALEQIGRAHV